MLAQNSESSLKKLKELDSQGGVRIIYSVMKQTLNPFQTRYSLGGKSSRESTDSRSIKNLLTVNEKISLVLELFTQKFLKYFHRYFLKIAYDISEVIGIGNNTINTIHHPVDSP